MAKLEIRLARWSQDHEAAAGEANDCTVLREVSVDGEPFLVPDVEIVFADDVFLMVKIKNARPEFRASYGPSEYWLGTDDETLVLPVTELVVT